MHLEAHEFSTVHLLIENGYNIELIPPSQIEGMRTPDMVMNGSIWEMKSPDGGSKQTIKNNIQNAKHQACNMILDLRRCKVPEAQALKDAEMHFKLSKRLRKLKIITKDEKYLILVSENCIIEITRCGPSLNM